MNNQGETKTPGQIIDNLIIRLKTEFKYKEHQINRVSEEHIQFTKKTFTYFIFVEDEDSIQYGVQEIEDVDLSSDFFTDYVDYENLDYFEEFMYGIEDGDYKCLETIPKELEKLQRKYEDHRFTDIFEKIVNFLYC